jgi:proteasome assembly chaperone (PAC2) family protein
MGQSLFTSIQVAGLPGVEHVGHLTDLQMLFLHEAWAERQRQIHGSE